MSRKKIQKIVLLVVCTLLLCFQTFAQQFVKHTISPGLIMAGYQGWFNTPDDGAGRGWYHYQKKGKFEPGFCKVDMWPDMSEYEKQYPTAFKFDDGSVATTFSSHDASTVKLHFKWMMEYGIDGVFLQRFVNEIKSTSGRNHFNKVLQNASKSALEYDRTICIMYDLSGMRSVDVDILIDDWKKLKEQYGFDKRARYSNYLMDGNRPVVAIWGVGFNDNRNYNLKDAIKLIQFLKSDEAGNCSVMLGIPTYWREQGSDCVKDANFLDVVRLADIIHPWFVGRYDYQNYDSFKRLIGEDRKWCDANKMKYMPVVFPGFSWYNMKPNETSDKIPRNKGNFFWKQIAGTIESGAEMIYVAMFDEIDEGTAIMKCAHKVPVGKSIFVSIEKEVPTDHYLWLTGIAGKMLRGEIPFSKTLPERK
ncbi:MAG: glycoside hydrolase family 71/99-like protein [Tenuifilaceae bacterium]